MRLRDRENRVQEAERFGNAQVASYWLCFLIGVMLTPHWMRANQQAWWCSALPFRNRYLEYRGSENNSLLLFSCPVVSDSLWSHGLQHTRPPYPSPSPKVCPSSSPLRQWCHPAISSSDALFFCPQSFPASGTFPMSRLFTLGDQNTGASASVLPLSIQSWFPFRLVWSPCGPGDFQESSPVL